MRNQENTKQETTADAVVSSVAKRGVGYHSENAAPRAMYFPELRGDAAGSVTPADRREALRAEPTKSQAATEAHAPALRLEARARDAMAHGNGLDYDDLCDALRAEPAEEPTHG